MEKKYQIFISSTYKDLIEARSKVRDEPLDLSCVESHLKRYVKEKDLQAYNAALPCLCFEKFCPMVNSIVPILFCAKKQK